MYLASLRGLVMTTALPVFVVTAPQALGATPQGASALNPAFSVILDGRYQAFDRDPEEYRLAGFQLGEEAGPGKQGFSLGEIEFTASANADDWFYGQVTFALADAEEGVETEIEEAYIDTLALDHGLKLRAGRFYSSLGYLNAFHSEAWDFADAPLVYRALFADQLNDDGIQASWIAPTDLFIKTTLEYTRGADFPASGSARDGKGAAMAKLTLGGDVGAGHSWQTGLSYWSAKVAGRDYADYAYTGDSDIGALDVVWKWAPDGNPREQNLKLAFEYFLRNEDGEIIGDPGQTSYDGKQQGWYAQGVYQFLTHWRVGLRLDRLTAENTGSDALILADAGLDPAGHDPQRWSAMIEYDRSAFSRLRLQYNRDESGPEADNQVIVQYVISLGAHGAHQF